MAANRIKLLFPALPALTIGIILLVVGTCRTELACDRSRGSCTFTEGVLGGNAETFPITDVHKVWYEGGRGKHGNDGQVNLVLTDGGTRVFGKGDDDLAKATAARAQAFFAGQGPVYRYRTRSWAGLMFLGGGFLLGALGMTAMGLAAQRRTVPVDAATRKKIMNRFGTFALVVTTVMIGGSITTCAMTVPDGTLVVDCNGKIEERSLKSGAHTVDVGGKAQVVEIADGETTSVSCK